MAAVESTVVKLGSKAPLFKLPIVTGGNLELASYTLHSKGVVIAFICNHCPYVKHINQQLVQVADKYLQKGVAFIAISSNDVDKYPEDSPEKMLQVARELGYPFPYLFDETQEVAKSYQAACTPDFYVYDQNLELVYHGQFDDSRPGNDIPVSGKDLETAIERLLEGKPPVEPQRPSIGCNIKWIPGNEPDYFNLKS